jgi:mannose-6-phosphate isomerase
VPVRVTPWLDPKPWGSPRLAEWGIALPAGETIGEAHLAAPQATVAGGELAGLTLGELAQRDPAAWVGAWGLAATGGRAVFPLLVKFIASGADLSIQVHPDDRAAAAAGLGTGKTEAYHILDADPGSVIYLGLLPDADPDAFCADCRRGDGSAARFLRQIPAAPGMTLLIPAGTPHALGEGITLYEIQQPSNVTFRLDDWGRRDAAGRPRELHHAEGFAVLDPTSRPDPLPRRPAPDDPRREVLVATPWFVLERIAPGTSGDVALPALASPQVLTVLAGTGRIVAADRAWTIGRGETLIVPAGCAARLGGTADGVILRGWVPEVDRDAVPTARRDGSVATT